MNRPHFTFIDEGPVVVDWQMLEEMLAKKSPLKMNIQEGGPMEQHKITDLETSINNKRTPILVCYHSLAQLELFLHNCLKMSSRDRRLRRVVSEVHIRGYDRRIPLFLLPGYWVDAEKERTVTMWLCLGGAVINVRESQVLGEEPLAEELPAE